MSDLPLDLLFQEVLPWLPVKSLVRFMSVSKLWYSFLKQPEFAIRHLKRQSLIKDNQKILFTPFDNFVGYSNRVFIFDHMTIDNIIGHDFPLEGYSNKDKWIVCSCDGMVCISIRPPLHLLGMCTPYSFELLVWNPSTGDYKKIKSIPRDEFFSDRDGWLFYYDSIVKDYKKLNVHRSGKAYMYSFKSNSWRLVGNVDGYRLVRFSSEQGVIFNGCVFWVVDTVAMKYIVLSFDLSNQQFVVLPLEQYMSCGLLLENEFKLTIYQGCLHVFLIQKLGKDIQLWKMKNKGGVWEKTANLISASDNWKYEWSEPICFMSDGKLLMMVAMKVIKGCGDWVIYDPKYHRIEKLFEMNKVEGVATKIKFMETLVSPSMLIQHTML